MTKRATKVALAIALLLIASTWAWLQFGIDGVSVIIGLAGLTAGVLSHRVFKRPQQHTGIIVVISSAAFLIAELELRIFAAR